LKAIVFPVGRLKLKDTQGVFMEKRWENSTEVPELPPRKADSNKGSYGRILIVAGSRGMSGAAVLCGSAALRGGAGLVKVATPCEVWPMVAVGNPCYMTVPLEKDKQTSMLTAAALAKVLELARGSDVLAVGPGLGQGAELSNFLGELIRQVTCPLVLDADALNVCAQRLPILDKKASPIIITPHPGEFGRLLGKTVAEVQVAREELAVTFARRHELTVLLKGHGTIVTDGKRLYVNTTGNPGMATAGSGDVLTGLIAALLGQGLPPFEAAQLGAHVHGLAGDLACADLGEEGLIATDLIKYLPAALKTQKKPRK
jgi:ADP-dependent NAD(P)H-hydrate dehydratase